MTFAIPNEPDLITLYSDRTQGYDEHLYIRLSEYRDVVGRLAHDDAYVAQYLFGRSVTLLHKVMRCPTAGGRASTTTNVRIATTRRDRLGHRHEGGRRLSSEFTSWNRVWALWHSLPLWLWRGFVKVTRVSTQLVQAANTVRSTAVIFIRDAEAAIAALSCGSSRRDGRRSRRAPIGLGIAPQDSHQVID